MNKSDLVERMMARTSHPSKKDVKDSVELILDNVSLVLCGGGRAEIRGFGSFFLNHRPYRLGRNPKTGASVPVPEKYVPHFRPGKEMKAVVNR